MSGMFGRKLDSSSPLLPNAGSSGSKRTMSTPFLAAIGVGLVATALLAMVLMQSPETTSLIQTAPAAPVMYYYVPEKALRSADGSKLPLELSVPQGKGKKPITYTLIASPLTVLDGNASAAGGNGTAGGAPAAPAFSCTLDNIKAKAGDVFKAWDACASSPDFAAPNADAKRRLLSLEKRQRTTQLNWQILDGNATGGGGGNSSSAPGLRQCESAAVGNLCSNLAGCKNPVCASYYTDPDVERICGICTMSAAGGWGCFAADAEVTIEGLGKAQMNQIEIGDKVEAVAVDGSKIFSRVYFIHDHAKPSSILQLEHSGGKLELTPTHSLPVYTPECGERYCEAAKVVQAKRVKIGDRIYVSTAEGYTAQPVTSINTRTEFVRYVLTESENLVVGGAVASVLSTAAGSLETLPFYALEKMLPGVFQSTAVASAIYTIMESPILRTTETFIDKIHEIFGGKQGSSAKTFIHAMPQPLSM